MRQFRIIGSGALGMLCLFPLVLPTKCMSEQRGSVWGKRIWERKIDKTQRIVVDERGVPLNDSKRENVLVGLTYYWRLLKDTEIDGPVLFRVRGVSLISGTGLPDQPIQVLYTDLISGDLVTAFNQRERCWAYVVHRNPDGTFDEKPLLNPPSIPQQHVPADGSIGPAMKSAEISKAPGEPFVITVTNDQNKLLRFEMRSWKDEKAGRLIYYWLQVASPTTRAGPTAAPGG